MKDKPTNIHIFVNCASIPKKSIRIGNLHKFSTPLASHTVVTRSSTRKLSDPHTNNYTTKNIETAKYFKTEMVKLIAAKLTEKIQSAYGFDSKKLREKESVIQAKAAQLYDTLLTQEIFEGFVKEYLDTENEEAFDKFLENAFVGISQLVYDDISWLGDIVVKRSGGGSAAKASKNKNTRKNTETLKDFKTEMVKRLAVNLTERLQKIYSFTSKTMREKKSVIQAKAVELYDVLLTQKVFDYLVKEYLETKNEEVYDKFLASAYTTIHQLLFEDISWFEDAIVKGPSFGGGTAKKTRRCRRSRINRK